MRITKLSILLMAVLLMFSCKKDEDQPSQQSTPPSTIDHPTHLTINSTGTEMYYLVNGNVFSISTDDAEVPGTPWIEGDFYALNFHPDAEILMATDAMDFQQNGKVYMFSTSGVESAVYDVGVIPGHLLPLSASGLDAVIVSNEGPFSTGSGSLSMINLTTEMASSQVFENTNGYPLGNIVQSTHHAGDYLYAVVNNAQKIEVMDFPGFASHTTIDDLGSPRYMVSHNEIGYVSDWTSGGVHTIDLNNHQVNGLIPTGPGPEMMCIIDERLFVANSGGFGVGNTVTVIDLSNQSVIDNIEVADNPHSLVKDANGKLRVLCRGISDWSDSSNDTSGALFEIDPQSLEVTGQLTF